MQYSVSVLQPYARYEINGSQLVIKNIRRGDRGAGDNAVYQCNATNVHGSVWTNFYLNIIGVKSPFLAWLNVSI